MRAWAALLALLVPGCARANHAPPTPAAPTRLRVVCRSLLSNAPVVIADEEGYFRKQNLQVEFVPVSRSQDALPLLIKGELDVMVGVVYPGYFNAIARGAELRIVAEIGRFDPDGCTYAALLVRKGLLRNGSLQEPVPSRKWRIDTREASSSGFILDKALARERLDPARFRFDHVPLTAKAEALRNGAVDLAMGVGSQWTKDVRSGSATVWHTAQSLAPDFTYKVVAYGPSLVRTDTDAGRRLMTAYLEGVRQYNEGKTERNLQILEKRLGLDRETLLESCWITVPGDASINVQALLEYQAWANAKGLLDRPLAAAEFWEPRFVRGAAAELAGAARDAVDD